MIECVHNQRAPEQLITNLHANQGGWARHRCPVCSYREGVAYGLEHGADGHLDEVAASHGIEGCKAGSRAPIAVLRQLPTCQGGPSRHRCAVCSFQRGFEDACRELRAHPTPVRVEAASHTRLDLPGTSGRRQLRDALVQAFLSEPPGSGTGTLSTQRRYLVEPNLGGYDIVLRRPAWKNKGFDFVVRLEGYNFAKPGKRTRRCPTHGDLLDALAERRKESPEDYRRLYGLVQRVYACEPLALRAPDLPSFASAALPTRALLGLLKWLFAEQDIAYWSYSGRAKLWGGVPRPIEPALDTR